MFSIENHNPVVIYHRGGRLMRPSDHRMPIDGLGGVDGFLDVLKNFGSGIVKYATGGIYDPNKNRFYVPFSSGQVRNFAQGFVNTHTLGLVKTDKFFNSQTMRTIGTVVGATAAAATAAVGARLLSNSFGSSASSLTQSATTGTKAVTTAAKTAAETAGKTATSSLFSFDTAAKVLDLGTKVIGSMGGSGQQPQMQQGGGAPVVIVSGGAPTDMYPPVLTGPNGLPISGGQYFDPYASGGVYSGGGGMPVAYSGGGSGGGIGPPGSEYAGMDQMVPQEAVDETSPMTKALIVGGGVLVLYYLFKKK